MSTAPNGILDKKRFIGAIIYFILAMFLFFGLPKILNYNYFYNKAINNFSNYPRFFWCIACSFWGFSIIAFQVSLSKHDDKGINPLRVYLTEFLIVIITISTLVFGILHIYPQTSNYIFYFLATPITFFLSYSIDKTRNQFRELLSNWRFYG